MLVSLSNALLAICAVAAAQLNRLENEGRIVGGVPTTIQSHPYQVSLQTRRGAHFCGGSIISPRVVVTAAHCLVNQRVNQMRVRLGSTTYNRGGKVVGVTQVIYNEYYNSGTMSNDVGLVKLAQSVAESATIRYIQLAQATPATGTLTTVTGWGTRCYSGCRSLPKTLQAVQVNIVKWQDCGSNSYRYGPIIDSSMVCAYAPKKDACQGDSGGPLAFGNQLVGIVSWGTGCASNLLPGVYADVSALRSWIVEHAQSLED